MFKLDKEILRLMGRDIRNKAIIYAPSAVVGGALGFGTYKATDEFISGEALNIEDGDEFASLAVGLISFFVASFLIQKKTKLVTNSFGI